MRIAIFEKKDRLHFFLIITSLLLAMLVLCSSCSSPDIPLPIEDDITDNRLYTLSFYSNGEIITEKSVSVGTIVGDVKIPNIDTEQYDVKWYIDSSFTGSPINLNQYVLPSQPPTTFYAQLVAKYYDILINKNNGEDPIPKRVYASFFNEETPVFSNYEVVPGRFITLVFDGWYINGNKIVSNNYYCSLISEGCTVYAGWKLPKVTGSQMWEATRISIPYFITTLADSVFENWGELKEIIFDDNPTLRIIGSKAFAKNSKLLAITIPDSVTDIRDAAFKESSLKSCLITESSQLTTIGKQAFYNTKIESINLPNTLTYIDDEAFCACFGLSDVTIDEENSRLTTIGKYAFSDTAVLSFVIPRSVERIVGGAFSSCNLLTQITMNSLNTNFQSIDGVLYQNNVLVAWPDGKVPVIIPEGITEILDYAFGFSSISSIQLPTTLLKIGVGAFEESMLQTLTLPDSVVEIMDSAFYLSDLRFINISANSNLSRLGARAFYGTKLSSFTMPPKIVIVGTEAFQNRYLLNIGFYEGIKTIGDYFNKINAGSIILPDSVVSIVSNAFLQNTKIYTNKQTLAEISEYGLSDNQIARYIWLNKTTKELLE